MLFVQGILSELALGGTCAIVLDKGLLFRTNEAAFVETKRKLLDECELWAIVSLPGGVFSTASVGVKTNLLFFTKGGKTSRIWYYDLSWVKVGKKTPLTLAHFGFGRDGAILNDDALPIVLLEKAARDLETEAGAIDAAIFDLKAVNSNAVTMASKHPPAKPGAFGIAAPLKGGLSQSKVETLSKYPPRHLQARHTPHIECSSKCQTFTASPAEPGVSPS